jgi:hypothetical protein
MAQASLTVRQFLASTNMRVITHPPYSDSPPVIFPIPKDETEAPG